jgi:hypothetical protein
MEGNADFRQFSFAANVEKRNGNAIRHQDLVDPARNAFGRLALGAGQVYL